MGEMFKSPEFTQPFTLKPVDLSDQSEVEELISQRHSAGWDYELSTINKWHDEIQRGCKFMWWITVIPSSSDDHDSAVTEQTATRVGHVALASETFPPDPELARSDRTILTVKSFFILSEHRQSGLGRATWLEVENRARQIPECQQIAIDTLDRRYIVDDGPDWGGFMLKTFGVPPHSMINEDWYARMGYVPFKRVRRYVVPGTDALLMSVYMRKSMR